MECCGTYPGSYAGAHSSQDEGIAQTVLIFHKFHFANILLLKDLFPCGVLVRNRGVRDIHKSSGMFLRVDFDDLNLLSRTQDT